MAANTIDQAFITHYGADVHAAYQRQGSKLRSTVRNRSFGPGEKTVFQKVGKGTATKKSRHGNVVPMNVDHSNVELLLEDWYAPEYIDDLDLIKTNVDERMVVVNAGAYALGRKTDDLIFAAMEASNTLYNSGTAVDLHTTQTVTTPLALQKMFNAADVPDDGRRFVAVGPATWELLNKVEKFIDTDYVEHQQMVSGTTVRRWLGMNWFSHSGLDSTADEICYAYHSSAVGFGWGQDTTTHFDWVAEKVAWLANSCMSQGAKTIDPTGVIKFVVNTVA